MKPAKYIGIILTTLIVFSNIGLALNVHYCHDSVSSVSITYKTSHYNKKQKQKSCCAMAAKASKKCCKTHVVKLQDKTDTTLIKQMHLNLGSFCAVNEWKPALLYSSVTPPAKKESPSFYCDSHAPPLFKLYCQYIFYA